MQAARFHILVDQGLKTWLINRNDALIQGINLVLINVYTCHMDTHFTETGARD